MDPKTAQIVQHLRRWNWSPRPESAPAPRAAGPTVDVQVGQPELVERVPWSRPGFFRLEDPKAEAMAQQLAKLLRRQSTVDVQVGEPEILSRR